LPADAPCFRSSHDLAEQLGRRQRPEARLSEQLRRGLGDDVADFGLEVAGGDVSSGARRLREMHDAIAFHVGGLWENGEPIPEPSDLTATYVDVAA
jgi:hypothetical protein